MTSVPTTKIVVVFADENRVPLGTFWRFTAKKSDFYLEPLGSGSAGIHLSIHGPQADFDSHRFHIKLDESKVDRARQRGTFLEHALPAGGQPFRGRKVAEQAYLVCRMRWLPALREPEYLAAARPTSLPPLLGEQTSGAVLSGELDSQKVWDLDIMVSFGEPFWPEIVGIVTGNPRLGPLANDADMYLTILSSERLVDALPNPPDLVPPPPAKGQTPNRIMCGGIGVDDDIYWWVETITAREAIEANDSTRREISDQDEK